MSTPQQPSTDVTAQRKEQARRGAEARHTNELRELATELARPELAFDPATVRKGTVVSFDSTGTPPTLGITLSGDLTITVSGVRFIESYSPTVGDTVLILKQGTDVLVLGPVALVFPSTGVFSTILIGADTNLFRDAANVLRTNDSLVVDGNITASGGTVIIGGDVNLFRNAANVLRTNDSLIVDGSLTIGADVNLFRDSSNVLRTNDSFVVDGALTVGGSISTSGQVSASGDLFTSSGDLITDSGNLDVRSGAIATGKRSDGSTNFVDTKINTVLGVNAQHDVRQPVCYRVRTVNQDVVILNTDTLFYTYTFTARSTSYLKVAVSPLFYADVGLSGQNYEPSNGVCWYQLVQASNGAVVFTTDAIFQFNCAGHPTWGNTSSDVVPIQDVEAKITGGVQYQVKFFAKRFNVLAIHFQHMVGYLEECVRVG